MGENSKSSAQDGGVLKSDGFGRRFLEWHKILGRFIKGTKNGAKIIV